MVLLKKKKILLQCHSLIYYYMGLAAIYTKHPKRDVEVDVLIIKRTSFDTFLNKIKESKYSNDVFVRAFEKPVLYKKFVLIQKNLKMLLKYHFEYKKQIIEDIRKQINLSSNYSEIYFCHEQNNLIMTSLKFLYPKARFIIYGDGSGGIFGSCTKFINFKKENPDYKFFREIKPDEVVGLLPSKFDDSIDITRVRIRGTNKDILVDLIENDSQIQNEINKFTEDILEKYKDYKKSILLLSKLDGERFMMSEEDQANIYIDIINKYCPENSVLILKGHPGHSSNTDEIIKRINRNIEFIKIPENMKEIPIECYIKLLKNMDNVITFLSSSVLSITYLYNIDCIDALDIIKNYRLFLRVKPDLTLFRNILQRIPAWDKKSLIYECDNTHLIKDFYKENDTK